MRRLVFKLTLFSIPVWIYVAFIWMVDPFDMLRSHSFIPESAKERVSLATNPPLWRMSQFMRSESPNILLGDSRMGHISVRTIKAVTGDDYVNLSNPGAKLIELIRMFWFAARHRHLKNVVIGINFDIYNQHGTEDRTGAYESINRNPLLYFVDPGVVESAAYEFKGYVLGSFTDLESPNMSREQFWKNQLAYATNNYRVHAPPVWAKPELKEIADYCRRNDIRLAFGILPTHVDLQGIVEAANLTADYRQFKEDIAALATTYDYDFSSPLTRDRENFADPFHFSDAIGDLLIREIWLGQLRYGRRLGDAYVPAENVEAIAVKLTQTSDNRFESKRRPN